MLYGRRFRHRLCARPHHLRGRRRQRSIVAAVDRPEHPRDVGGLVPALVALPDAVPLILPLVRRGARLRDLAAAGDRDDAALDHLGAGLHLADDGVGLLRPTATVSETRIDRLCLSLLHATYNLINELTCSWTSRRGASRAR